MNKWIAMWVDGAGKPRAWASSENKELAKEEAKRQLDTYISKKRDLGEPMSRGDFKLKVRRSDE